MNPFERSARQLNSFQESTPDLQVTRWVWFVRFAQVVVAENPAVTSLVELVLI